MNSQELASMIQDKVKRRKWNVFSVLVQSDGGVAIRGDEFALVQVESFCDSVIDSEYQIVA